MTELYIWFFLHEYEYKYKYAIDSKFISMFAKFRYGYGSYIVKIIFDNGYRKNYT